MCVLSWSVTKISLRVFHSSVRRKMSGSKREEIAENVSELRNEEPVICNLH